MAAGSRTGQIAWGAAAGLGVVALLAAVATLREPRPAEPPLVAAAPAEAAPTGDARRAAHGPEAAPAPERAAAPEAAEPTVAAAPSGPATDAEGESGAVSEPAAAADAASPDTSMVPAPAETAAGDGPAPEAPAPSGAAVAGAEPASPPSFDHVRVAADGSAVIAGRAAPGAEVRLLLDDRLLARALAGPDGAFAVFTRVPPAPQAQRLELAVGDAAGSHRALLMLEPMPPAEAVARPDGMDAMDGADEAAAVGTDSGAAAGDLAEVPPPADGSGESRLALAGDRPAPDPVAAVADAVPAPQSPAGFEPAAASGEREGEISSAGGAAPEVAERSPEPSAPGGPMATGSRAGEGEPVGEAAAAPDRVAQDARGQPAAEGARAGRDRLASAADPAAPPAGDGVAASPALPDPAADAGIPGEGAPAPPRAQSAALAASESSSAGLVAGGIPPTGESVPAPAGVLSELPALSAGDAATGLADAAEPPPRAQAQDALAGMPPAVPPGAAGPQPASDGAPAPQVGPVPQPPRLLLADERGVRVLQPGGPPQAMDRVALDSIAYAPDGSVMLAGRGTAEAQVRVYLDNAPLITAEVGPDGQWRTDLPEVDRGVYTLRLDQIGASGRVTSRTETPFLREDRAQIAAQFDRTGSAPPPAGVWAVVQPGNSLWEIARRTYGDGFLYVRVLDANRERIRNPDLIYPGQVFDLP